jgi:hypothetical protein
MPRSSNDEQELHVGVAQDIEVLLQRIARIDRRPGDAGAHDAQQAGVGRRMVGAVDRSLRAAPQARRQQTVGDAMRLRPHVLVGPALCAVVQAVPVGIKVGAAVEIVDQAHQAASRLRGRPPSLPLARAAVAFAALRVLPPRRPNCAAIQRREPN